MIATLLLLIGADTYQLREWRYDGHAMVVNGSTYVVTQWSYSGGVMRLDYGRIFRSGFGG